MGVGVDEGEDEDESESEGESEGERTRGGGQKIAFRPSSNRLVSCWLLSHVTVFCTSSWLISK